MMTQNNNHPKNRCITKAISFCLLWSLLCLLPLHIFATTLTLTDRQLCDLEMLLVEGFYPLKGFLGQEDYESVVKSMRLTDGTLWPIPITLDIDQEIASQLHIGDDIDLQNEDGISLATLHITDIWTPDKTEEAQHVYGTTDTTHPGVAYLFEKSRAVYIGGPITPIQHPSHYDFTDLRKTPQELRSFFQEHGIDKIVAFQTRNPMHKAHVALTQLAAKYTGAHLLISPIVGKTKLGDIDPYTRVRCYRKVLNYFPEEDTTLCVLPLAMRMAGPKEALWHAIIRKNYGCTHFIIGRDHAGPGNDSQGIPFYHPYAAQDLMKQYAQEIGIEPVLLPEIVFVKELDAYLPVTEIEPHMTVLKISGTELRRRLLLGLDIPEFLSYPEVIEELRMAHPPLTKQGITLFFTGLSGAGKSTLAKALSTILSEIQYRKITLLDGDVIRKNLSPDLGFSANDRSLNVRRVGFVASEITKNGGLAICSLIAPYESDRNSVREYIAPQGKYVEIYLSTPLEICEERDVKGLYAKARRGEIPNFTGIDDPYEIPQNPDLIIDTSEHSIESAAHTIIAFLQNENYIYTDRESKF